MNRARPFTLVPAVGLCALAMACQRPDPIRLEPTFEEPAALVSMIRISDPSTSGQLLRGFYPLEANAWRWAGPRFAVTLGTPPGARQNGARLTLVFHLPDVSIEKLKEMTIAAKVGDVELPAQKYETSGDHEYRRELPASVFTRDELTADFTLDQFLTSEEDARKLSVIVKQVGFEPK